MVLWKRSGQPAEGLRQEPQASQAPAAVEEVPASPVRVGPQDLERALGARDSWEPMVTRIRQHFAGLPSRVPSGLGLMDDALRAALQGVECFERSTLWRRLVPEARDGEPLRLRLRLALFYAVVFRVLGSELCALHCTRGVERWDPLGSVPFRTFVEGGERPRLLRDTQQVHGGYPLLLACALFGRQEIESSLGRQAAQEAFVYLAPGGQDSLFGQILGDEVVDDAGVSPDVARQFLEVLRGDVEAKRVDVNENPADVLVLPGWLYLIYPQGFRRVVRHLRNQAGIEVTRREELLLEILRQGAVLNARGEVWEAPVGDGWKGMQTPPGVCIARIVFTGKASYACRLKGVVLREASVFGGEAPPEVERFLGGVAVFPVEPHPRTRRRQRT